MSLSVDSLLKLPEGAAYRESNSRAHVEATHRDGVIYITGTCDSLQRQVEYYENLYRTARDALDRYHEVVDQQMESRSDPLEVFSTGFILGLIAGISMILYVTNRKTTKQ